MAIDHAALRLEIQNDPRALGYDVHRTSGADNALADLLNQIRAGANFEMDRGLVDSWELVAAVKPADWDVLLAPEKERLRFIVTPPKVDLRAPNIKAALSAMFPNPSDTRTALLAFLKREGSRCEKLFGDGARVSLSDIAAARGAGW